MLINFVVFAYSVCMRARARVCVYISDGKFHMLPTGELIINNLEYNDRFPSYRCRTMHRLTRQVVASSSAKVRVTGMLSVHCSHTHTNTGTNKVNIQYRIQCQMISSIHSRRNKYLIK